MNFGVVESFLSFQGEGVHAGRAAFFVRLYGCDQKCGFCDSAATWHPDHKPRDVQRMSADDIANAVTGPRGAFVVLTGGEPALYNLAPLVDALHSWPVKRRVHIETAGHKSLPHSLDWITLSPKLFATPPLPENWERASEIKLICESPEQIDRDVESILRATRRVMRRQSIWLHPEWSQRRNPDVLHAIVEAVKSNPRLRAGVQMHKYYRADEFDPNARRERVPLGGEANRGDAS